jgi:hypothetical protein
MTSLLLNNQGENSNNYKTVLVSSTACAKKIEIKKKSEKTLTVMSSTSEHKNMFFSNDENYDSGDESSQEFSDYSDAEFSPQGDRFEDDYEETQELTTKQVLEDKMEVIEMDYESSKSLIQDPDTMKYIRPARVMPSHTEQDHWLHRLLTSIKDLEEKKNTALLLENERVFIIRSDADKRVMEYKAGQHKELCLWKKIRSSTRATSISQLSQLPPFEDEYSAMIMMKTINSLIKSGIEERIRMQQVKADSIKAQERLVVRNRKAGKARAIAKQGMNKRTAWHTARNANSLVIKTTSINSSITGEGKRTQRKIRQEKDRIEAIAYAERLGEVKKKEFSLPDIEFHVDLTDEERAAEKEELDIALALINRICVEKASDIEKREAEEEKAIEEKKKQKDREKKEKDRFVKVINRNKKPKVIQLGFIGLKEQAIIRRKATDTQYNDRCEAFIVLANKEKLSDSLKFTALCKSVVTGKKCYHTNCKFAHKIEDLVQKDCRFGIACKFVRRIQNLQYINKKFGQTGKTCSCIHPGEDERGFYARMGVKFTTPVTVTTTKFSSPPINYVTPLVNVWTTVVKKAERETNMAEYRAKMTKPWAQIVVDTLTADEKKDMYGRGVELLGVVDQKRDSTPIIPTTQRKPWDNSGLGFTQKKTSPPTHPTKLVSSIYFNWVKGMVLKPENVEKKSVMDMEINKRITEQTDIVTEVNTVIEAEINMKMAEINMKTAEDKMNIARKKVIDCIDSKKKAKAVKKAKEAKAVKKAEAKEAKAVKKAEAKAVKKAEAKAVKKADAKAVKKAEAKEVKAVKKAEAKAVKKAEVKAAKVELAKAKILEINQRFEKTAKVELAKAKILEINQRFEKEAKVELAKAKILEINQRFEKEAKVELAKAKILEINQRFEKEAKYSHDKKAKEAKKAEANEAKVELAKAKILEINQRFEKKENEKAYRKMLRKAERMERKSGSKKVKQNLNIEKTVLMVKKADAESALISAINNGLVNFRIQYID